MSQFIPKLATPISVCIATGASLTQSQVNYVRGKAKIYVVNDAYKLAPWADVLYACDHRWWEYHKPVFAGRKVSINEQAHKDFGIELWHQSKSVWSDKLGHLATGGNSGFQCLNLADLEGAGTIILLGYDMKDSGHFFGEHPSKIRRDGIEKYSRWVKNFREAAPHIKAKVINCTPNSALDCFPMAKLESVL